MRNVSWRQRVCSVIGGIALVAASAGVSFADDVITDADKLMAGDQHALSLSATPGQVLTVPVDLYIDCTNDKKHMDGATTLSYSSADSAVPAGGSLSATSVTISKPGNWP